MAASPIRLLPFLSGAVILAGCVHRSVPRAQIAQSTLRQTAGAMQQAFTARDANGIVSFFAEDAVAMYPNWPQPVLGREANRRATIADAQHTRSLSTPSSFRHRLI